jgi:hypothetical protein
LSTDSIDEVIARRQRDENGAIVQEADMILCGIPFGPIKESKKADDAQDG